MTDPSAFPPDKYTPYYCEENIHLLIKEDPTISAVFISTEDERTLLFHQKAGRDNQFSYVFWDYHVVGVKPKDKESGFVVIDYDSTLGFETDFMEWFQKTVIFPLFLEGEGTEVMRELMQNLRFRVTSGDDYIAHFASDRSHMRNSQGDYLKPPPKWDCPRGEKATCDMNLHLFRKVTSGVDVPGEVLDVQQMMQRFGGLLTEAKEDDENPPPPAPEHS